MDRKSLRKQNQLQNQAKPIVPPEKKGHLESRDINTGKDIARIEDGGSYTVDRLFKASVNQYRQVQLNSATQTADYFSSPQDINRDRHGGRQDVKVAARTATAKPVTEGEGDPPNPLNESFGSCGVCNGKGPVNIDCKSGNATVIFDNGSQEKIKTPAVIEYGAKVTFKMAASGKEEELAVNTCGEVRIYEDRSAYPPFNSAFGDFIRYEQRASSVSIGGTVENIQSFQIYGHNDSCESTVVVLDVEDNVRAVADVDCDSLAGSYAAAEDVWCISIGDESKCGIDPDSVTYECTAIGYHLCNLYQVFWTQASTGKEEVYQSCDPIGYELTEETDTGFTPSLKDASWPSVYQSGIGKSFTVYGGDYPVGSGNYGWFTVARSTSNECLYRIYGFREVVVGVTDPRAINGSVYLPKVFYEGGCGFEVTLGASIMGKVLVIKDADGNVVFQTSDFIEGSVKGCKWGGFDIDAQNVGNDFCRTGTLVPIKEFEKTARADDNEAAKGIYVNEVLCN